MRALEHLHVAAPASTREPHGSLMRLPTAVAAIAIPLLVPASLLAQTPLTLADVMHRARTATPESRALATLAEAAGESVRAARAGYLPRIDLSETVQRGNQPVFVFSSLLSQRRFAEANFAIPALNDPDPVTNVRTTLAIQQSIFDFGATRSGVRVAQLEREQAVLTVKASGQDLAFAAAQAFVRVLQLEAAGRAAGAALQAAESDVARARARRETGLATQADALAAEVHLADARQREISARADLSVARLQLNVAIGEAGDAVAVVAPPVSPATEAAEDLLRLALTTRPDLLSADLAVRKASEGRTQARAAFLPRVDAEAAVELNGARLADQQSSWVVGAHVQINVFRGFSDAARLGVARQGEIRARAEREALARRVEVDVRAAVARLAAARMREEVGRAAVAQAREAQRVLRDRYESGLATMTDVLRAAEAVFDAEARATTAETDVILQWVALEKAVGRL